MNEFLIIKDGVPPFLSILIFLPLAGALVMLISSNANFARLWALLVTIVTAAVSMPLYYGFDTGTAKYQFGEHHSWIPAFDINYTLGVDGISLLLVLMTTLLMPLCVLGSWRYIQKRVREFMVCLLIMEASMIGVFVAG